MSNITNSSQMAWLRADLANRRASLMNLICRLTGLGPANALSSGLYGRFTRWLDEIATLKRDEIRIMARIEDVEREHRLMRQANKLRRAAPSRDMSDHCAYNEQMARRPMQGILLLVVLWYLFMRQKINQKKQALTAD